MKLTSPEWRLMNALWQRHPATAREISSRLSPGTDWAYTTIKTMLSRLVAKGALREERKGKADVYSPLVSRRRARIHALQLVAADAFEGALGPLMHFLVEQETLSSDERNDLVRMLDGESQEGEDDG